MKIFKNRAVAWVVLVLAVVGSVCIGLSRKDSFLAKEPVALPEVEYQQWICDEADMLSDDTVAYITERNADWDAKYYAVVAVATADSIQGWTPEEAAKQLGADWKLGKNDMLLLMVRNNDYYVACGDSVLAVLNQYDTMQAKLKQSIEGLYYSGDFDGAAGIAYDAASCGRIQDRKYDLGGKHMLDIQHLTKRYGEKKAVDDLTLHIAAGEIYGFIGHNGAGKTTTLKSVVGILQFDQGEITIDGKSIKANPLGCKREMAYIPDNPDLYDFMTGIKYLNFVADIFGVGARQRQERIRKYADAFELTEDLAQPIAAYSHGMKQKLAIIAAWLHQPKLIIMDEPFVGLDPKASHLLKGMMREVCDEGGAIFFSTHVLEVAEKLCDKVAIIKGGKLIRSGTMEEVKGDDSLEEVFLELEGEEC